MRRKRPKVDRPERHVSLPDVLEAKMRQFDTPVDAVQAWMRSEGLTDILQIRDKWPELSPLECLDRAHREIEKFILLGDDAAAS